MKDLVSDFGNLVRKTENSPNIENKNYSLHDTPGLLILCQKGDKSYYKITTVLISQKELDMYSKSTEGTPHKIMFDLIHDLSFNGDDGNPLNKQQFDIERVLFSIEKKKVFNDMFGLGDVMFNSATIKFKHHEFYYQIIVKKQKKNIGRGPKNFNPKDKRTYVDIKRK